MPLDDDFDPYKELQLAPDAEPELVKAAFKALAKKYHPDRFSDPAEKARAEQRMQRINEAQRLLASGQYVPPRRPPEAPQPAADPPPRVVPPPPPKRQSQGVRKLSVRATLLLAMLLLAAVFAPVLLSTNHLEQGKRAYARGRFEAAREHLDKAIEGDARNGEAYFQRARVWVALGHPERAEVDYQNARGLLGEKRLAELEQDAVEPSATPTPQSAAQGAPAEQANGASDVP